MVDKENRLVGIVTFDDAMDVIQEETREDFDYARRAYPCKSFCYRHSFSETDVLDGHYASRAILRVFQKLINGRYRYL